MPTYEYACRSCGEHLEVVQSFKDEPLKECPSCAGELRKVFSPIGITFKGSGFYKTDSRSVSGPGREKKSSESGSGPGGKSETAGTKTETSTSSGSSSSGSSSSGSSSSGPSASQGNSSAAAS